MRSIVQCGDGGGAARGRWGRKREEREMEKKSGEVIRGPARERRSPNDSLPRTSSFWPRDIACARTSLPQLPLSLSLFLQGMALPEDVEEQGASEEEAKTGRGSGSFPFPQFSVLLSDPRNASAPLDRALREA
ncbi:hypothetical protein MTO96_004404 [Rhipicephalus appendiculatus]